MCRWSHFQELLGMGSHIFGILGVRLFFLFMVSKRTSMFVLQMKNEKESILHGSIHKNRKWLSWDCENYIFAQKWLRWGL